MRYALQTTSGETLSILKEALGTLNLERCILKTRMFVAEITDEFTLGLDVIHVQDAAVYLRR
jgi:hypothetical protein